MKFKHCCDGEAIKPSSGVMDEVSKMLAMNPQLTLDEINVFLASRTQRLNDQPLDDFCGKSPNQIQNWLYAPFSELTGVKIRAPSSLEQSPIMSYLKMMIEFAIENGQAIKLTGKGNLPTKLVKQASVQMRNFAMVDQDLPEGINPFAGSQEEKFLALHYTKLLAELAGIFHKRLGQLQLKKSCLKEYQASGIGSLFIPMLEAATRKFNWSYFDGYDEASDIQLFWVFMTWRLLSHGSVDQMVKEVNRAFPSLSKQIAPTQFASGDKQLARIIECRFAERFLSFWGFAALSRKINEDAVSYSVERKFHVQPLMQEAFQF